MAYNTEVTFDLTYTVKKIVTRSKKTGQFTIVAGNFEPKGYTKKQFPKEFVLNSFYRSVNVGDIFSAQCQFRENSDRGYCIQSLSLPKRIAPSNEIELAKYIKKNVKGIGKESAKKIVDTLGVSAIDRINEEASCIDAVSGLTGPQKKAVVEWCQENFYYEELMLLFQQLGLPLDVASQFYDKFGTSSITRLSANPYILYSQGFLSFRTVDKMVRKLGKIEWNSPARIVCTIRAAFDYYMENYGDTCIRESDLTMVVNLYIDNLKPRNLNDEDALVINWDYFKDFGEGEVRAGLKYLIDVQEIYRKEIDNAIYLYRKEAYYAEVHGAVYTRNVIKRTPILKISEGAAKRYLKEAFPALSESQQNGVISALNNGMSILTGGPGTGKTFTMNAVVKTIKHFRPGAKVVLLAPTAKAAGRMREISGLPAATIHSALKLSMFGSIEDGFQLDADYVIVDEFSMVGSNLYYQLMKRITPKACYLFIGDSGQLPSVEYGKVLQSLIESGAVPVTQLDVIYRQSGQSMIITNASYIRAGTYESIEKIQLKKDTDFQFIQIPDAFNLYGKNIGPSEIETASKIMDCVEYLVKKRRVDLKDILVLCPVHATLCGTESLNAEIQDRLNPRESASEIFTRSDGTEFHLGDRVIHMRNNKKLGVRNGDIGVITNTDGKSFVDVQFDAIENVVTYKEENLEELELAYAITVHKAQGSEAPYVIMPFLSSGVYNRVMNNSLIYTGITRSRVKFIGIGSFESMKTQAIKTNSDVRLSLLSSLVNGGDGTI